jgi:hypothetical protein
MHSLLLVLLLAQASQPPTPSAAPSGREQQSESSAKQNTGNPLASPTPTATASPVVSPGPGNQGNQKPPQDWWIVTFTGLLTLVAFLQWLTMVRQSRHMRAGLIETRKAADAATVSAKAADATIGVMKQQGEILNRQTEILSRQAASMDLTNAHTVAIERASVGIAMAEIDPFEPRKKLQLVLKLANSGRLPATLIEVTHSLLIDHPLEDFPVHTDWIKVGGVIPPGDSARVRYGFIGDPMFSYGEWEALEKGKIEVYVYGAIRYTDGFGNARETGFGFRHDRSLPEQLGKRLSAINIDGFNYMR